jgi:cystathionine beta-lyase/cystathionine gamma-synthase
MDGDSVPVFGPSTRCVHGPAPGRAPAGAPLVTPLVRSTTFVLDDAAYALRAAGGAAQGLCYGRERNPTVAALEERLAALEGAERALAFASGQAALHAILCARVRRGTRVVLFRQLYGGTLELCRTLVPMLGGELAQIDSNDLAALEPLADGTLALVLCESLSNPLLHVADLPRLVELLRRRAPQAALAVDATLASPLGQRPLAHGATFVWHSATKYLGGHSDLLGGVVAGTHAELDPVWSWRTRAGGCLDPEAAFLMERGLRTLALRFARQSASALELAQYLAGQPAVARVHHCGLAAHPHAALARQLLAATGGLFSFELRGGDGAALTFLRALTLFQEAASLGGVESLATRPRDLSQAALDPAERARAGLGEGLVRLAVGIEDVDDLRGDLERALART